MTVPEILKFANWTRPKDYMQCREMEIKYRHREEIESETRKKKWKGQEMEWRYFCQSVHIILLFSRRLKW